MITHIWRNWVIDLIDPDRPKIAFGSITFFVSLFKKMDPAKGGVIDPIDPYSEHFLKEERERQGTADVAFKGRSGRSPPQKRSKAKVLRPVGLIDPNAKQGRSPPIRSISSGGLP